MGGTRSWLLNTLARDVGEIGKDRAWGSGGGEPTGGSRVRGESPADRHRNIVGGGMREGFGRTESDNNLLPRVPGGTQQL